MEEKEELFTSKLEEKIYHGDRFDDSKDISRQLNLFFSNLIKRKRNTPIEGGLQASLIILEDAFAAKVNEDDGMATHARSQVNLVKYLNHDKNYITNQGVRKAIVYKDEVLQLSREGIEIRILDGEDHLMLAIYGATDIHTKFQMETLQKVLFYCRQIKEKNFYKMVEIGLHTPSIIIDFGDFEEGLYQKMLNALSLDSQKMTSI